MKSDSSLLIQFEFPGDDLRDVLDAMLTMDDTTSTDVTVTERVTLSCCQFCYCYV